MPPVDKILSAIAEHYGCTIRRAAEIMESYIQNGTLKEMCIVLNVYEKENENHDMELV